NWQCLCHGETSSGATAEAHMNLYLLTIDQRHILNQQAQNAFPLTRFDGWIIPESRKIGRQREQLLASPRVDKHALLLRLLLIMCLRLSQSSELIVPLRFQAVTDKSVSGIHI